jgi:Transposase IS4
MGIQPLRDLRDYWQLATPISKAISRDRFLQIRQSFVIRESTTSPKQPNEPWWFRVEPLATTIRQACQHYWAPGAHVAIDESMVPYLGHTRHTIKAPHKPIKEGYKIWALGDLGYIYNWLWYSKTEGTEATRPIRPLAETQSLVINLAKSLPMPTSRPAFAATAPAAAPASWPAFAAAAPSAAPAPTPASGPAFAAAPAPAPASGPAFAAAAPAPAPASGPAFAAAAPAAFPASVPAYYTLYLDNLFTNVPLVNALGELGIAVMGTTRQTALGLPKELSQLKQAKKPLKWGYLATAITNGVLCFLWQDNNKVLGMTTAYNLHDTIIRSRNRPSATSTSASITRPIFGDSPKKNLPIPIAIDAYNHYMGGVDLANQLRASFTTLQPQNLRYWKPLFYWLLDIALVNSYLLFKAINGDSRDHRDHRKFLEALVQALMAYGALKHSHVSRPSRAYCAYCWENRPNWKSRHLQPRAFGTNIINISEGSRRPRIRGSKTQWGCDYCNVALCKVGDCWDLWHRNKNN